MLDFSKKLSWSGKDLWSNRREFPAITEVISPQGIVALRFLGHQSKSHHC